MQCYLCYFRENVIFTAVHARAVFILCSVIAYYLLDAMLFSLQSSESFVPVHVTSISAVCFVCLFVCLALIHYNDLK